MRILHIIDPTTPEDTLFTLACITRRVAGEHQVLALGHKSVVQAAVAAGVDEDVVHFARAAGWWDPSGWRGVHRQFHANQPDHLHCWGYWAMAAAAMPKRLPTVRMISLTALPSTSERRLLRMASRRAPWFVICSTRDIFDQMRCLGLPRDQLAHVPPGGPEMAVPRSTPGQLRKMLDLSTNDQPVVFLGGTSQAHNRQDQGLWAAAILQQIYPRTHALIRLDRMHHSPRQDQVRRLTEFAQGLPHPEMIHFIEPDVTVETVLAAADMMLFTPDQDVDSTMLLRAMVAGVPVVATSVPGVLELVGESGSALVVRVEEPWPLAAAAHQLLSNSEQTRKQTAAARVRVETAFSSARLLERFSSIYRQLQVAPQQPLAPDI